MAGAANGNKVSVHYTGTLQDGSQFDSSLGRDPLQFELGAGSVIPGFEKAVVGMEVGEKRNFTIPSAEAYGAHDPSLVQDVPRSDLPPEMDIQLGSRLSATAQGGQEIALVVTGVTDESVRVDANHPLAGEDLTFEIELVEVE